MAQIQGRKRRNGRCSSAAVPPGACVALAILLAALWLTGTFFVVFSSSEEAVQQQSSTVSRAAAAERGSVIHPVAVGSSGAAGETRRADVTLKLDLEPPVSVALRLYRRETPDAARFLRDLVASRDFAGCRLYRAEPVPPFWGNTSYPDSYFGGRWGPPYALIQGQFLQGGGRDRVGSPMKNAGAEDHKPVIRRGHVAWAGGEGGPHFFVALADHPEWGTTHTVWGEVSEGDMVKLDELVEARELKTIKPKRPPNLSYFVEPIDFSVGVLGVSAESAI